MQPQQPYEQPPASSENTGQYEFILGSNQPSVGSFGSPGNKKKMLLIVTGGAILTIGLIWIILSLVLGGGGKNTASYVTIVQQQAEMIRITQSASGQDKLTTQDAKNFASNAQATLGTDQKALINLLAKNGTKIGDKTLAALQSTSTDNALNAAKAIGTYDATYVSTMQSQLKAYQTNLQQTYQKATSTTEKGLLKKSYDNSVLLLEQSNQRS